MMLVQLDNYSSLASQPCLQARSKSLIGSYKGLPKLVDLKTNEIFMIIFWQYGFFINLCSRFDPWTTKLYTV